MTVDEIIEYVKSAAYAGLGGLTLSVSDASRVVDEIERLNTEIDDWCEMILHQCGYEVTKDDGYDANLVGWIDTQALTLPMDAGDRLVDRGKYEQHPIGFGRRQFYRKRKGEALEGGK